ncbi:MAG: hypothetical protein KDA89_12900 [Planctomycetaceae bacterium]|nr:hypothetical protein [Planctomycetaceae bacterium]
MWSSSDAVWMRIIFAVFSFSLLSIGLTEPGRWGSTLMGIAFGLTALFSHKNP